MKKGNKYTKDEVWYFIKEEEYQKFKRELKKDNDYFSIEEITNIYRKIDVILT